MRHFLPVLGLLILLAHDAMSQRRDLKLSPPEPITFALPDSIRIQAADAYGSLAIVVWGSNRRIEDSTLATVLWAQVYRDSVAIGNPFRIHSNDARPSWKVSVCATTDGFLVAWNDARAESPGVYYAVFDELGGPNGEEQRVPDMGNDGYFFRALPSSTHDFVIVASARHDTNRTFHAQYVATDGRRIGGIRQIGNGVRYFYSEATSIDVREGIDGLLMRLNGTWFAVGRRLDSIREVTIPLCGHFVVRDDGGVLIVCGDTLRRYSSLFGVGPFAVARVPLVDGYKLLGITPAASGDSLMIFGVTHRDVGMTIYQQFIRVRLTGALAVTGADTVSQVIIGPLERLDHDRTTAERVCSSAMRIKALYTFIERDYKNNTEAREYWSLFQTDGHGQSVVGDVQLVPCERAMVIRLKSDTVSTVLFIGDTLSIPTTKVPLNTPQRSPVLDIADDHVRVIWNEPTTAQFVLRSWPSMADTATSLIAPTYIARIAPQPGYQQTGYKAIETAQSLSGSVRITAHHEEDEFWRDHLDRWDDAHYFTYAVYTPTDSAWVRTLLWSVGGSQWHANLRPGPLSFDPVSRLVTGGFLYDGPNAIYPVFRVFAIDDHGSVIDTLRTNEWVYTGTSVLYDGPNQYLLCDKNEIRRINPDTVVSISRFASSVVSARIQRLADRRFIRHWRDSSDMRNLVIERYDFAGNREAHAILRLQSKGGQLEIAEARDGRLYVVHADTGVYAHVLDSNLENVSGAVRISSDDSRAQRPSVYVHHDSLIAVWEDERNDGYDVYCVAMSIEDVKARIETPRQEATKMILATSPQPARDYIDIALASLSASALEVRLYDINSRVSSIGQIASGSQGTRLNVGACPSGVYVLDVRSSDRHEQRRIVIVR